MRPRFTLSTTGSPFMTKSGYADLANHLGAEGLDLDATSWAGRVSLKPGSLLGEDAFPVSSIWITPADTAALGQDSAFRSRFDSVSPAAVQKGQRVVVRLPAGGDISDDRLVIVDAIRALERCAWMSSIVLAVPTLAVEGGRTHLTRLRTLRRLVEEWEMELGLDLSPQTDNRWEAEAAVQIAGSRLAVVRLRAPLSNRKTDVHQRTVRACADEGFAGVISLAPITPLWLSWHRSSLLRDLVVSRDAIALAYRDAVAPLHHTRPASLR
jgi:hypothetical protein